MSSQSTPITTLKILKNNIPSLDLRVVVKKYFYHWPLFVIGLSISAGIIFAYLKTTRPVFEVKAVLLIQDGKKIPNQESALSEIDPIGSSKLIENEIEVFKSKQIIDQVVKDLDLAVKYTRKSRVLSREFYKNSPVKFTLLKPTGDLSRGSFQITIKDDKSFLLKTSEENTRELLFKNIYTNRFGSWKLEPTGLLQNHVGDVVEIQLLDPEKLSLDYQNQIGVNLPNKLSTAVVLSIDDELPERGKDILNQLIFNYNLNTHAGKNRQIKTTLDFLDQRIATLNGELQQAEKGIEEFKSSRGVTDISADSKINLESMRANDFKLNEVNVQLTVIEGIEKYINSAQLNEETPTTFGIIDVRLGSLIEKLSDLQLQRDRMLSTVPETSPSFEPINRQLITTKAAIKESVKNIKGSLLNTRDKLQSYESGYKYSIQAVPTTERELISIKRQQAIKENLYNYLLKKREEVAVSYAATLTEEQIVDQAYTGPSKIPKKPMIIAMAILLGLMLPMGQIYRKSHGKITDLDEIKRSIEIPVLGELPYETAPDLLAIKSNIATAVTEQFRVLRAKLYYAYGEKKKGRVSLITSSSPGEGKSFISSNLSVALAYSGRKTIILELDMRKPKISALFNAQATDPGITNFLKGEMSLVDVIQNSGFEPNLDFISAGSPTQNPSELLEGARLQELIHRLSEVYDDIVIDSPPLRPVSDALIISRLADITLYVIRQGVTEKSELPFIQELLFNNQLPAMNLILNGIQSSKFGCGYNYSHSYYNMQKHNKLNSIVSNFIERF